MFPASPGQLDDRPIVGREAELAQIDRLVDGLTRGSGGVLLFGGEGGVGKTALLDVAATRAEAAGFRVLRARGVEYEADVSFISLSQLLLPLRDVLGELEPEFRDALKVMTGLDSGPPPDRLLLSNAVLSLLVEEGRRQPVLLVVDDLPWVDRASATVLSFVAQGVAAGPLGFVGASRTEQVSFFERLGLPEHFVPPLDRRSSLTLLEVQFPGSAPAVIRRLREDGRGNPLALLELGEGLTEPQRLGTNPLPPVLRSGRGLKSLFAARVDELPKPTRDLLLVAALDGSGSLANLRGRETGEDPLNDLSPAEQARLISVDERAGLIEFRHPLVRSAVVDLSTATERRRIHRILAETCERIDQRAWHLAEASLGADDGVADLLEAGAAEMLRRGDSVGAVQTLVRAAELTPDRGRRQSRLAEAAFLGARIAGGLENVNLLMGGDDDAEPGPDLPLAAAAASALVLLGADGNGDAAHHMLAGSIEARLQDETLDETVMVEALLVLLLIAFFLGKDDGWASFSRLSAAAEDRVSLPPLLGRGPQVLAALDREIAAVEGETDPRLVLRVASSTIYLDRCQRIEPIVSRLIEESTRGGAIPSAIEARVFAGLSSYVLGKWDRADRLLQEASTMCRESDYRLLEATVKMGQGLIAAWRGDFDTALERAEEIREWSAPRLMHGIELYCAHLRAVVALGQGRPQVALREAQIVAPIEAASEINPMQPDGTLVNRYSHSRWILLDLVEAAVRSDRIELARGYVTEMRSANLEAVSSRLAVVVAGAEAMVEPADEAEAAFERALALPEIEDWPVERARIELAFGERLRRNRAVSSARAHLSKAREIFDELGAEPWIARAEAELQATASRRSSLQDPDAPVLTPQELEIARLAARGLTNKEIGARLYLSHRTIGAHLYRIFPKLGVRSRAGIRDALTKLEIDLVTDE
jgi:DNA-binding CsgD family transcriptional regulator